MKNGLSEKIVGYLLLFIGVVIILYSGINVYQVFTKQIDPINLFAFNGIGIDFSKMIEGAPPNANLTQELVAPNVLNQPMNYIAHVVLMGFIGSIGYKLASIATMLVRPIHVTVKEIKSPLSS